MLSKSGTFFIAVGLSILFLIGGCKTAPSSNSNASAKEDNVARYERQSAQANGVIVFVHGVFGDGTSTWTNANGKYWPHLLTEDSIFDGYDIYVFEFPSPFLDKSYSIDELADYMRLMLNDDKVLDYRELIFLTHSMGGLITRAFITKYQGVAPKVKLIYFFSTPTTGSQIARLGSLFSKNPQLGKMLPMESEDYLANLQRQWLAAGFDIPSYCAYEKLDTFGQMIVEQPSATNLCNRPLSPILENHIGIVKPNGPKHTSYVAFKAAFQETIRKRKVGEEGIEVSLSLDKNSQRTATIFNNELIITLSQITDKDSPHGRSLSAVVMSPGYKAITIEGKGVGDYCSYEGKHSFEIQILGIKKSEAKFFVKLK